MHYTDKEEFMKRENTRQRLDKILTEDREEMNEPTRIAALADFSRVAREYFETDNVDMNMKRCKTGTDVILTFRATRVKNFTTLK